VSSVTLSLLDAPVSELATRSGVDTVGAVVSTMISSPADVVLLPAASVATACTKCEPSLRENAVSVTPAVKVPPANSENAVPPATVTPSTSRLTKAPASASTSKSRTEAFVRLSVLEIPLSENAIKSGADTVGGVVSAAIEKVVVEPSSATSKVVAEKSPSRVSDGPPAIDSVVTLPSKLADRSPAVKTPDTWMKSSAPRSVIRSPSSATNTSPPAPPDSVSPPEPPISVSAPRPPTRVSAPEPPDSVSLPPPPDRTSAPPPPRMNSSTVLPVTESLPEPRRNRSMLVMVAVPPKPSAITWLVDSVRSISISPEATE